MTRGLICQGEHAFHEVISHRHQWQPIIQVKAYLTHTQCSDMNDEYRGQKADLRSETAVVYMLT